MAESKSLPSIQKLAQSAWELFKKTWVTYLKLSGVTIAFVFLAVLGGVIIILPLSFAAGSSHFNLFNQLTPFNIAVIILFIIWFILFFLSLFAIEIAFPIAGIFILQGKNAPKIFDLIKSTKPFFWSYLLLILLCGFLVAGGMILLVIPGLLIAFFLSFVLYEVVIGGHKGMTALKHSFFIVKNNFWGILVRLLVLELTFFILTSILNRIASRDLLFGLVQFLFSLFASWYARAYMFVLYKEVRSKTTFPQQISINWIWIVSIIGWAIIILLVVGLASGFMHFPAYPSHRNRISPGVV